MDMLLDPTTRREMVTASEAAKMFGCTTTYIAKLARQNEVRRLLQNSRTAFYDLQDVKRLAREKAAIRKKRGGRPPNRAA
jgi:hypothetical protein